MWYALNPLVIIELSGNLHFEAVMIFFCAVSIYFLLKNKMLLAGIFLSLAVATKLFPLIFIPFLIKYLKRQNRLYFFATFFVCSIILFIPFLNPVFLKHFLESVSLYFQSFEFNGSIYKLLRWIGYKIKGYNIIQFSGILLPVVVLFLFVKLYSNQKKESIQSLLNSLLLAFTFYFYSLPSYIHGI